MFYRRSRKLYAAKAAHKADDFHWAGDGLVRLTEEVGDKLAEKCLYQSIDSYLDQAAT